MQVLIREGKGKQPIWVDLKTFLGLVGTKKKKATAKPSLLNTEDFDKWWNLYSKKCTKRESMNWWAKKITPDLVNKIMEHTKLYVESTEKKFRLDPIRYLKREKWNDEIIKQDKRIDIKEYKHDTTGMPMGKCEKCGKKDTYLNQWELYQGSRCCVAKVLPFN
tara:strand:- start:3080 stop:3568 length:489 start_codon:yes stop_codon:yes gene_type:complete